MSAENHHKTKINYCIIPTDFKSAYDGAVNLNKITLQFKNYLKTLPKKLHGLFKRQEDARRTSDNTFNRKFNGSDLSKKYYRHYLTRNKSN